MAGKSETAQEMKIISCKYSCIRSSSTVI